MLRLFGIQLHPVVRVLIGAGLIALGVLSRRAGLDVVGGIFVVWALVGLLAPTPRDAPDRSGPDRHFR